MLKSVDGLWAVTIPFCADIYGLIKNRNHSIFACKSIRRAEYCTPGNRSYIYKLLTGKILWTENHSQWNL